MTPQEDAMLADIAVLLDKLSGWRSHLSYEAALHYHEFRGFDCPRWRIDAALFLLA